MARPQTVSDEQILHAAREAFSAEGPAATVHSIAERLGVTHSAIHQRFGSKRDLFLRAMCPEGPPREVVAALRRGPRAGVGLHDQLRPLLWSLLGFLRVGLPQLLVLRAAGADRVPEASESMPAQLRAALSHWVAAAGAAGLTRVGHAEAVAEGLLGALEARALNEHLGAVSPELAPAFIDLLLVGLVPAEPATTPESHHGQHQT